MLLFKEQLYVNIPDSFQKMDKSNISEMYPYEERPQIILENRKEHRFCTFSLIENHGLGDTQIEYAIQSISNVVTSLYPSCLLEEAQLKECRGGTCGWFSFKNTGSRGEIHNVMYIFPVNGCMMLGTMGCMCGDKVGQGQIMQMIESIEAWEKKHEKRSIY